MISHIGLKAEYIFSVFGLKITNSFFTTVLVTLIIVALALIFYFNRNKKFFVSQALKVVVYELLKFTDKVTGDRKLSKKVLPLAATFFIFIVCANLLALIPGFLGAVFVATADGSFSLLRSPNSDLTTTLSLALISVLFIQVFSFQALGLKEYLKRFFDFSSPIAFILGFFEMISEAIKILSFSFRLFGNVFAGEVLLLIIAFLVPYIIPIPFSVFPFFYHRLS